MDVKGQLLIAWRRTVHPSTKILHRYRVGFHTRSFPVVCKNMLVYVPPAAEAGRDELIMFPRESTKANRVDLFSGIYEVRILLR